jgi:murein L,D-transpeptidase YafK
VLVFFKDRNRLELYAGKRGAMKYIRAYRVLAASGHPGPKLREGDQQVPEGIYKVESLNPNSQFHVSLKLSYPNSFDQKQGKLDGRSRLGGDIMIHGNSVSIGCLALGDAAIEEIFSLALRSDLSQWKVILAPYDLRHPRLGNTMAARRQPRWVQFLYKDIESELRALP